MNAKTLIALSAAVGLAAFAGCQREQQRETAPPQAAAQPPATAQPPAQQQAAPSQQQMAQIREMCPILVEDTTVEVAEMEDGVALVFTTQAGDIQDLRQRVRQTAAMYEIHGGKARVVWQPVQQGAGQQEMMVGEIVPAVRAQVQDVEGGAAIMLMPQDQEELTALRQQMAMHQQRLQGGSCWILQERAAASPAAARK